MDDKTIRYLNALGDEIRRRSAIREQLVHKGKEVIHFARIEAARQDINHEKWFAWIAQKTGTNYVRFKVERYYFHAHLTSGEVEPEKSRFDADAPYDRIGNYTQDTLARFITIALETFKQLLEEYKREAK